MSDYQCILIKRLINSEITSDEIKAVENQFNEAVANLNFVFWREIAEDGKILCKFFKHMQHNDICLLVTVSADIYEDEQTPPLTDWGHWQLCDDSGNILCYFSAEDKTNITLPDGDMTACFGFWTEGLDLIPAFINRYLARKQKGKVYPFSGY